MGDIVATVDAAYSARAREGVPATCTSSPSDYPSRHGLIQMNSRSHLPDAKNVAEAFGYTEEQLSSIPEGSHMGLSCGNPVATANIKEVILIPN